MIDTTIQRIEERLRDANLSEENREELTQLLEQLKQELNTLSQVDEDQAKSVASFAEISSHEAMRGKTDPELLDLSLKGLSASVEKVETEQPALVKVVNSICMLLSNSGI